MPLCLDQRRGIPHLHASYPAFAHMYVFLGYFYTSPYKQRGIASPTKHVQRIFRPISPSCTNSPPHKHASSGGRRGHRICKSNKQHPRPTKSRGGRDLCPACPIDSASIEFFPPSLEIPIHFSLSLFLKIRDLRDLEDLNPITAMDGYGDVCNETTRTLNGEWKGGTEGRVMVLVMVDGREFVSVLSVNV